jgi:hypothetical protein
MAKWWIDDEMRVQAVTSGMPERRSSHVR